MHQIVPAYDSGCPQCESRERRLLFDLATDRVVRCESCGLTYALSPPVENAAIYNAAYFSGQAGAIGYQDYQSEYLSHSETFRRRLRKAAERLGGKGRLLDYGCAHGHLGQVAVEEGWTVVATDIAYEAVHRAVHRYGLAGFVSDLARPPLKNGAFDLVTLYDVIEHVREPKRIINALRDLLSERGLLHLTTPDVGSASARLLGARWYHYKPQEHLLYFSRKTLRSLLESCGMRVDDAGPAASHMAVHDILARLRRYNRPLANASLRIAKALRLDDVVVKIHVGEMQAWARPLKPTTGAAAKPALCEERKASPVQRLLSVLACPSCGEELQADAAETRLTCRGCEADYEIRDKIPILLPKAVPTRKTA